jgi:DNA primase
MVLLGEQHLDPLRPVVLVEGPFDYAKVYRLYRNVVCNLTTSLSAGKVKKLKTTVGVVAFFDDDVAGVEAALTLKEQLKHDCAYSMVEYPPLPKGKEKQDPGDAHMTLDVIAKMLKKHVTLDKRIG